MANSLPIETLQVEEQGKVVLFTLLPAVIQAPWADVERSGERILDQLTPHPRPKCVIDLSQLDLMGSSVVALITRVWKSIISRGGDCVLVCPNDVPREVISIAGLNRIWTVVTTRPEALAILQPTPTWPLRLLSFAAILSAIAAGVGLALKWTEAAVPPPLLAGLIYGGAVAGVILGLCSVAINRAPGRYFGLIAVILSVISVALAFCFGDSPA